METKHELTGSNPPIVLKFINIIMIGYAVMSVLRLIMFDLVLRSGYQDYTITDWLINYQAGFVRRGLLGELLFHISSLSDLSPKSLIIIVSTISFTAVCTIIIRKFRDLNLNWWILPLNVCLAGADFLRKDYLCFLFIIAVILSFTKIEKTAFRVTIINILLILLLNFHEAVFFIICPFVALAFWRDSRIKLHSCVRPFLLIPVLITFYTLSLFKGDATIAQTIHNSWNIEEMGSQPAATILSLSWDLPYAVAFHIKENFFSCSYPIYGKIEKPLLWLLTLLVIPNILFSRKSISHTSSLNFFRVLIFQFISLFPMFTVLSCDQSRIFFYWTISSICIYIHIPEKKLAEIFPEWTDPITERIRSFCTSSWAKCCALPLLFVICISPFSTKPKMAFFYSVTGSYTTVIATVMDVAPSLKQVKSPAAITSLVKQELMPALLKRLRSSKN